MLMFDSSHTGLCIQLLVFATSMAVLESTITNDQTQSTQQPCNSCCTGATGSQGAPGIPGVPGTNGIPGNVGPRGETGVRGDSGLPGEKGEVGEPGLKGAIGAVGIRGPPGKVGPAGIDGTPGIPGVKGQKGITGQGMKGIKGQKGESRQNRLSAFSAARRSSFTPSSNGQALPFDAGTVHTNVGDDFNAASGRFTCEIPGIYLFTYSIMTYRDNILVHLMKNDVYINAVFRHDENLLDMISNTAVLQLAVGDEVWLRCRDSGSVIYNDNLFTTFSGVILHEV